MTEGEQTKSKERVKDHAEVFTSEKEVKAMCDLVKNETERIDSRFLEPACGDGNFLREILERKLKIVRKRYGKSKRDYEKYSLLAVSSIYGVEILKDNVLLCRERLFSIWDKEFKKVCKEAPDEKLKESINFILIRNIVLGNALTLKCVDSNANDIDVPIVFSEWAFITGGKLQRQDYTLSELLEEDTLFSSGKEKEGTFLKKYVTDYREVANYEQQPLR